MKRYPLTLVSLVTLWVLAIVPHPDGWRVGTGAPLAAGHWWGILTSLGWCADWPSIVVTSMLVAALVPVAERTLGARRSVLLLLGSQVFGQLAGLLLANAMVDTGEAWAYRLTDQVVVGPAGAVIGLGLATTAVLPVRWRRRLRITLVLGLVMFALYSGLLSDILRLTTGLSGLALGLTLRRARAPKPSLPESRLLIAVLVVASAIGPLIAAIGRTRIGPLSVLRYVFTSPQLDPATVTQLCSDPLLLHHCAELHAQQRLSGLGPAIMSIIPVLVLLAAAEGLRRGRRAAWFTAMGTNLVLFALGIQLAARTAQTPAEQRLILGPGPHLHTWLVVGLPAVQPLLVVVLLALTRSRFAVRAPAGALWAVVAVHRPDARGHGRGLRPGQLPARRRVHRPRPTWTGCCSTCRPGYLPPNYLGDLEMPFQPTTFATTALYEWTGVVFWTVACVGALATFIRYEMSADRTDQARVRQLLAETGGSSLAHLASWPGQSYWFSPDGDGRGRLPGDRAGSR